MLIGVRRALITPKALVGGGVVFSITQTDKKADSSGISTITYNAGGNPSLGATNGGKRILVIAASASAPGSFGACLVNGATATQLGFRASGRCGAGIYCISDSAAGTSALSSCSVQIAYGNGIAVSEIGVYVVTTSTPSQTPSTNNNASFVTAASLAQTVTIPSGGGGIGVVAADENSVAGMVTTWTSMSADYSDDLGGGFFEASATHTSTTGASVPFTANFSPSAASSLLVIAGFAP